MSFRPFFLALAAATALFAQAAPKRFALILEDPPVSERFASRGATGSVAARNYRAQIEARQLRVRSQLESRNIPITGSVTTLLNAVFVVAPERSVDELKSLAGVKGVVALGRRRLNLNRATQLVNAPAAWNALGGVQNAGVGIKIAIIDTGIDQTHPAFQDSSLKVPPGYPICSGSDCAFTSNKVIVARSYIRQVSAGSDPNNPAADSVPDDYSPRDRVGHGTATASCAAGVANLGPAQITITGMAPKAFLGNYKIFGSPEVNDSVPDDPIILALEDAVKDHMDIASLSLGGFALTGPLDTGAACGQAAGVPCDLVPQAVESAVKAGMVVVIAAGNDGDGQSSTNSPAFGTIESPGDSPSAITAGATTNSHFMTEGVEVPGAGVPSNLPLIAGALGDGPVSIGAVAAPLRDVAQLGNNGLACSALPAGSLKGAFALIERGTCPFVTKVINAQNAGAQGVIFYLADQSALRGPAGLVATNIPAIMVANSDGVALKSFIDANPDHTVLIDPAAFEQTKSQFNLLAFFSSLGPTTGDNALKPDLVAVGGSDADFTDMYMAGQSYDELGDLYSANGYTAASGTSFATPLVAGAAALVKQAHPNFTALQIKSALVNTASQDVVRDEQGNTVGIPSVGAGKLDAGAAIQTTLTADPATLSFGAVGTLPIAKQLEITNSGSASVNLSLGIAPARSAASANVTLDKQSLALAAGASATVNVTLSGSVSSAGSYYGAITIQGGTVPLRVPYLFLAGNGVVDDLIGVAGGGDGSVGQDIGPIGIRLVDRYGLPVAGEQVTFSAAGGTLQNADSQTNAYGIAMAEAILGSQPGTYDFTVTAAGLSWDFNGTIRAQPTIPANGIVNAASFEAGQAVTPGSYISIFGAGLSDVTDSATATTLPLAIDYVLVSFDVPSAKISAPGHLIYVSPGQVNVQVPWELQGQSSVQVKVTINSPNGGYAFGNVYALPLADYSPALFESGAQVAALDVNMKAIGAGNPAKQGQPVQLYANGLGPVTNQPASGEPPAAARFAETKSTPAVSIGGKDAPVSFSGLAPGFPGLYQINVTVPTGLTPGTYPITVAIGQQISKASNMVVQ